MHAGKQRFKREAMLYEKLDGAGVDCRLCSHRCRIPPSAKGFCKVRENIDGTLFANSYGKVISRAVDPIEKKPLYHFLPGSRSFSVAAIGCNFRCEFCQNWQISQVDEAESLGFEAADMRAEDVVRAAVDSECDSIAYTYTEPTIFFEFCYDTARLAREKALRNIFVTNGYMTREALDTIRPFLDAANVDLKSFSDEFYKRQCKARLQPVLDSIAYMKKLGIWVEVTTLIIPEQNDSAQQLRGIAGFLAGIDVNIPWHISRFFPKYHFTDVPATEIESLRRAKAIGESCGLRFIYIGNVAESADTFCPECGKLLVGRPPAPAGRTHMAGGKCSGCGTEVPGVW